MRFIDTHCHLDALAFEQDLDLVIGSARENNVEHIIIPGADILDLPRACEISQNNDGVYFCAGVHPYHIDGFDEQILSKYLSHPKCIAVGECGLDYFRLPDENPNEVKKAQKDVFVAQIKLALEFDKPIILHVRESSNDVFEILREFKNLRGVLHCFNADRILLGLKDNFYYGIGGVVTFKNSKRLVEILADIPLDRLLLETDAPYLTPHPFRGERNHPHHIPVIAERVGEILGISVEDVAKISNQNSQRLFGKF